MGKRTAGRSRRGSRRNPVELWMSLFVPVYLLFPGFTGYQGISPAKTWTFYILTGLLLLAGGFCLVRELRAGKPRPLTAAQAAALAFLAFTLLSAFCSPYSDKVWYNETAHEAALTVGCYVLLFLVVSRWGAVSEGLFQVLFWCLVLFCLLCFFQALGGNPLGLFPEGLNFYDGYGVKYSGAYAGTIGNVDIVSAFLALTAPMLVLRAWGRELRRAWPCWTLAAVCLAVMVWIDVLCGLVGVVLGGVLCFLVLCPDRWRKWVLLACLGLGLGALALLWAVDLPFRFLHELHEILHGRFDDTFGTGRFYIWRQMLERIPSRLWTGVGPDMARFSGLSPFVRCNEAGEVIRTATITDAHCYPLHILYCQGLPALLSWLAVVGLVLIRWVKARRDPAAALLGAGLTCFLCAMLFCFSSIIVMPFFWLTMALIEARGAAA